MKSFIKQYLFCIVICMAMVILLFVRPSIGQEACISTFKTLKSFLLTIPPIFVCIGLLDVWVDKEYMIKAMGDNSGIKGILIAFSFGVITAVPIYALLPIAGILLKKECRLGNVLIFICSCVSIRIPLLLFEVASLGWQFSITRFLCNIIVVLLIAWFIEKVIPSNEKNEIYRSAKKL